MSRHELTKEALALPTDERIHLAQSLWESIEDGDLPIYGDEELRSELAQRLRDEPNENWKTHEQVMAEARRKYGC
jgi:putative addiction module component (TIGR02574 family)